MGDFNFDFDGDGVNDSFMEEFDTDGDGVLDFKTIDTDGDGDSDRIYTDVDRDGMYDTENLDTDNDGYYESLRLDIDRDGFYDLMQVDEDGDGIYEIEHHNTNGDGFYDTKYVDTDKDGVYDQIVQDKDHDGYYDTTSDDTNRDGNFDTVTYDIDSDGDGEVDTPMREFYEDIDGDGEFDKVTIMGLDDETGEFEVLEIRDLDTGEIIHDASSHKDELVEINPIFYDEDDNGLDVRQFDNFDPSSANMDNVIGDPGKSIEVWEHQGNTGRCALYAQKFIIEEYTGQDIDIEEFADIAEENGWFTEDGGTPVKYLDKMLEYYGMETEVSTGNDLTDIAEALNNGEKIIVGVDADEYWSNENDGTYTPGDAPNHAIEVIGIDYSDPDNPMIIVNDSGSRSGCGDMIPYQTFMDAWEDSDFRMVVCSGEEN